MKAIQFVAVLALLPSFVFAQSFGLVEVTDLPEGDTLNVRTEPNARSEIIAVLPEGFWADKLGTTEDGKWTRIAIPEGSAWVSSRYLTAAEMEFTDEGLPMGLQCFGSEPFWAYEIDYDGMTAYTSPMVPEGDVSDTRLVVRSQNNGSGAVWFETDWHFGLVSYGQCSDGMSDRDYPWTLHLRSYAGGLLTGCCTAAHRLTFE